MGDLVAAHVDRDVVRVAGPDASEWLQGQLSQDVAALAAGGVGSSAWSLLLQPQGKVDALVRVTFTGGDEWLLDTDGGWGDHVVARLNRFKLRVKADVERLDGWRCVALRGSADVPEVAGVVVPAWPTMTGVDLLGPDVAVPDGVEVLDAAEYEALRIEAGLPRMGAELDERVIPAEAGVVEHTASFTKGCYTGQELVARIDSRGGNVPRRLRGVLVAGDDFPPPGATLAVEDREVGALTSVARSARLGTVALAYVRREVDPPAAAVVAWAGGSVEGRVEPLPLAP